MSGGLSRRMPSSVRPRGGGSSSCRPPAVAPMSERQQMALLLQMTSGGEPGGGARSPGGTRQRADRNERGWTPLHEACNHGRYEVAHRLLQSGADANARGLDDDTPLHDAAANGHQRLARLLVERGADASARNARGKTPADVATTPAMRQLLLELAESSTSSRPQGGGGGPGGRPSRDDKKSSSSSSSSSSDPKKAGPAPSPAAGQSQAEGVDGERAAPAAGDVYEFRAQSGGDAPPGEAAAAGDGEGGGADEADPLAVGGTQADEQGSKRPFTDVDPLEESGNDEETKRKKRKDENAKEGNKSTQRGTGQSKGQGKQAGGSQAKSSSSAGGKGGGSGGPSSSTSADKKSPCASPKPAATTADAEGGAPDDGKADLKVPPLKIVIPQGAAAGEQDAGANRNGKSGSQRSHTALPYVVASGGSSDGGTPTEKEGGGADSPEGGASKEGGADAKKEGAAQPAGEDQRGGRVLRSHRGGGGGGGGGAATAPGGADGGGGSSPTGGPRSPTPPAAPPPEAPPTTAAGGGGAAPAAASAAAAGGDQAMDAGCADAPATPPPAASAPPSSAAAAPPPQQAELHPRKRKMKQGRQQEQSGQQQGGGGGGGGGSASGGGGGGSASGDTDGGGGGESVHPHDQPITNCYKLFLNIRQQIEKRRKGLFPVQPKPPQGFKDYLMNRCTYVLSGTAPTTPNVTYPPNLAQQMKDLFAEQEKERYRLKMQHVIEKEKLVLSVEQEILRVHGRAARALANQSLPFSVCTILRDEEVYNLITPEQEEKDRNARSRYNGRLFLSWLQDVDDKWEKIKEHMLLRHHNEAESLHAVQKMDWEWKMKEHSLCDRKLTPKIDDGHVPMVHVSDDFDLLPA